MTRFPLVSLALIATTPVVFGFNIVLDYGTGDFFGGNATAQAAVQAAADDLSAVLTDTLSAMPSDIFTSSPGTAEITIDSSLAYTDPYTGNPVTINSPTLAANEFLIYVGARSLGGSTLGQGGTGGFGISLSGFGGTMLEEAVTGAASLTSDALTRGGVGPIVASASGNAGGVDYTVNSGITNGNLWFDNDASTTWHFDHTTAVAPGTSDLYTVALHEVIHALGVGGSETWNSFISGTDWTGAEAIAENGTGTGLINATGDHIAFGVTSVTLEDGTVQEAVMDPDITEGTRKTLTELDVAFLRDLGFQTVPEPSSTLLLGLAGFALLRRKRA